MIVRVFRLWRCRTYKSESEVDTLKTLRYWSFFIFKFKITPKPLGVSMSYCIIRCFSCFSLITLKREKFRNSICLWSRGVEHDEHFPLKSSSVAHISVKIWQFTYTPKIQGREPRIQYNYHFIYLIFRQKKIFQNQWVP